MLSQLLNNPQLLLKKETLRVYLQKVEERENNIVRELKDKVDVDLYNTTHLRNQRKSMLFKSQAASLFR